MILTAGKKLFALLNSRLPCRFKFFHFFGNPVLCVSGIRADLDDLAHHRIFSKIGLMSIKLKKSDLPKYFLVDFIKVGRELLHFFDLLHLLISLIIFSG